MPDADPLADLAIRRRQLETHLLLSHDYREKVAGRLKLLACVKVTALILIFVEGILYLHEPKAASPVILGLVAITSLVLMGSTFLLFRAWQALTRLDEQWLTPDAKKTLEALRMELVRQHETSGNGP